MKGSSRRKAMRATTDFTKFIGATHVDSYQRQPKKVQRIARADESTERLARSIPYWPEKISYRSLEQLTGLSKKNIQIRVSNCHGRYMIFSDDDGKLSRLKPDLSNCI